jgi:hypothetical protein
METDDRLCEAIETRRDSAAQVLQLAEVPPAFYMTVAAASLYASGGCTRAGSAVLSSAAATMRQTASSRWPG